MTASKADEKKRRAADAALAHIPAGSVLGVGTGSTVRFLIEALAAQPGRVRAAVSSSNATTALLAAAAIPVLDLNDVTDLPLYIDGADEATRARHLIKGGGGALTREKIVAAAAARFICIIDDSKLVGTLGAYPLPIEVIPMARSYIGREMLRRGASPELRQNFTSDNGNLIIDCHGLTILNPPQLESELNNLAGLVTSGIFARRPADVLLLAEAGGVRTLSARKA